MTVVAVGTMAWESSKLPKEGVPGHRRGHHGDRGLQGHIVSFKYGTQDTPCYFHTSLC